MNRYDLFLISGNEYDYRLDKQFEKLKSLISSNDVQIKEFIADNASFHYRGVQKGSIQLIGYFDNDEINTIALPINRVDNKQMNGVILLNMNIDVPNCLPASTTPMSIENIATKIIYAIKYFDTVINKLKLKENE